MTEDTYLQKRLLLERGFKSFDLYKMPLADFIQELQKIRDELSTDMYSDVRVSVRGDKVILSGMRYEAIDETAARLEDG